MRSLVIGQIAMTCALLVASLLLVRSIINRQGQSLGYDAGAIVTARMNLETDFAAKQELRAFYPRFPALRATAGVTHVALTSRRNVIDAGPSGLKLTAGPSPSERTTAGAGRDRVRWIFATLGLRPLAGREFAPDDGARIGRSS